MNRGVNTAEVIKYTSFQERVKKVAEEIKKGRYVEIWEDENLIYSAKKWRKQHAQVRN